MNVTSTAGKNPAADRYGGEFAEQGLRELTNDETALVGAGAGAWAKITAWLHNFFCSDSSPSKSDGGAPDGGAPDGGVR
jgi:hypothetical protein